MRRISVVTVSLNAASTIDTTLRSLLNQSNQDFELVVVDGLSKDNTLEIVESFRASFGERLKLVSESDTGIYNAMNKGARLCSGEYIAFLNSDDYYGPEMIATWIDAINSSQADIYYGDTILFDDVNSRKFIANLNLIYSQMCFAHVSALIAKDVFYLCGGFDERYRIAADWALFLKAFLRGARFQRYEGCHSYFRGGGASQDRNVHLEELQTIVDNLVYPVLSLDYDDITTLYHLCKNWERKELAIITRLDSLPETTEKSIFLSSYLKYSLTYYQARVLRIEASKVWRAINIVKKLLGILRGRK